MSPFSFRRGGDAPFLQVVIIDKYKKQQQLLIDAMESLEGIVLEPDMQVENGRVDIYTAQLCQHYPTCTNTEKLIKGDLDRATAYRTCIELSEDSSDFVRIFYNQSWTISYRCQNDHRFESPIIAVELIDTHHELLEGISILVIPCLMCGKITFAYDVNENQHE